jgi:hypothetical protein
MFPELLKLPSISLVAAQLSQTSHHGARISAKDGRHAFTEAKSNISTAAVGKQSGSGCGTHPFIHIQEHYQARHLAPLSV